MNKLILISILLTGCATASRDITYSDGTTSHLYVFELGRTEAITALNASESRDSSNLSVGSANADVNVKAIDASGALIGDAIGTALKIFVGKP